MNIMNIQKIKPAAKKSLLCTNQVNKIFAEKLIEKYRTVRLRGQFGTLVFRIVQKETKKSDEYSKDNLSKTINNSNWFVKEYKPVIKLLVGRKEQITLRTIREKSVPLYIYREKPLLVPVVFREKRGEYGKTAETEYKEFFSSHHIIGSKSSKYEHEPAGNDTESRTTGLQYPRKEFKEKISFNHLLQPDNRLLQQSSTAQEFIYHYNNEISVNNTTKIHHTNLPSTSQHIKTGVPHTFGKTSEPSFGAETQKKHTGNNQKLNEIILDNMQPEMLLRTIIPREHNFIIKKYQDINQFSKLYSNIYTLNRNMRVQVEEKQHNMTGNKSRQLTGTDVKTETLQKELEYLAAPKLNKLREKQDQVHIDNPIPMAIHKKITGHIPKSKDSGLILYKPKQEKPRRTEEQKPPDILSGPGEVCTKAVTSSKPVKLSLADNPEEVSLIAEKVYGIIEKRLEIQKDRRGLR